VLTLIAIVGWYAALADVKGAFLLGDWESEREIYMDIPKGWEHHYPPNSVLKLLKTVYGARQSAKRFWLLTLSVWMKWSLLAVKLIPVCISSGTRSLD
jgi:Reverse transcriptase (RNA-dependent DNA polymerase)